MELFNANCHRGTASIVSSVMMVNMQFYKYTHIFLLHGNIRWGNNCANFAHNETT